MANEMEVSQFTDMELVNRLERLVSADRSLSAKLLVHLGEVDARGVFRELGYSSMFEYCISALHMSEAEAYLRIQAARIGRRFPLVIERFGSNDLYLSAIKLLAPHLTADNCVQLLDLARGKSKRQIELMVAELAPKAEVPARLRRLPKARSNAGSLPATAHGRSTDSASAGDSAATANAPMAPPPPHEEERPTQHAFALQPVHARAASVPLSPGRFKLELTLGQEAHDKLEQLRELLRHQNPSGDMAQIIECAITELLEHTLKKRFAQTAKPAAQRKRPKPRASKKSRYIPRQVVREVYARDAGQCSFVSSDGRRCTARGFLEIHHHETTHARGGEATTDNLRLTCRTHNALLAERDYGRAYMQAKLRDAAELVPERELC